MVVAYHYVAFGSGAWGRPAPELFPVAHLPASYGWLGVQLFFLISGFVICMSGWGRSLGDFAVARATRLYPAYWFAVLTVALVIRLDPVGGDAPGLTDVALNLTMLEHPLGVDPVDGVYWTLWAEARFYLLFALVVWKGLSYRRAVAFCLLWGCAAVTTRACHDDLLAQLLMPRDCWYFIAGVAFYLMYRFRPAPALWLIVGGCLLIAQHDLLRSRARAQTYMGYAVPHWPACALVTLFFLAVAAIALGWTRRVRGRWLTAAGALTYPLYLLHERLGWLVIGHLGGRLPRWLLLSGLVTGMVLAAWVVHCCVERPLARRLGHALRRAVADMRSVSSGQARVSAGQTEIRPCQTKESRACETPVTAPAARGVSACGGLHTMSRLSQREPTQSQERTT
ncbi:acyltransferase [Streptomyces cinnamoneus]|uniref:Acyltransferase n=2 Tax=Streptomyces cinnamoneus TaxID=53446 RepID=A0A2G1XKA0_STRCJ|nr:acyltransferase [Streptomyces cinnamoneus]PPT16625.1 acyltransferase [Streptomyces cinnamoneus]